MAHQNRDLKFRGGYARCPYPVAVTRPKPPLVALLYFFFLTLIILDCSQCLACVSEMPIYEELWPVRRNRFKHDMVDDSINAMRWRLGGYEDKSFSGKCAKAKECIKAKEEHTSSPPRKRFKDPGPLSLPDFTSRLCIDGYGYPFLPKYSDMEYLKDEEGNYIKEKDKFRILILDQGTRFAWTGGYIVSTVSSFPFTISELKELIHPVPALRQVLLASHVVHRTSQVALRLLRRVHKREAPVQTS
jgi:hypothetical protein